MPYIHLSSFPDLLHTVILPLNRWLHIVCTTLIVGGTLFYEFVIPKAIEDLKDESQLAVMGRVRWVFRRIVLISAAFLVITGLLATWRNWPTYNGAYAPVMPWWILHTILGTAAIGIAVLLTIGDRVPRHPIAWLRINFVIMLVAMFAADITGFVRQSVREQLNTNKSELDHPAPDVPRGVHDRAL